MTGDGPSRNGQASQMEAAMWRLNVVSAAAAAAGRVRSGNGKCRPPTEKRTRNGQHRRRPNGRHSCCCCCCSSPNANVLVQLFTMQQTVCLFVGCQLHRRTTISLFSFQVAAATLLSQRPTQSIPGSWKKCRLAAAVGPAFPPLFRRRWWPASSILGPNFFPPCWLAPRSTAASSSLLFIFSVVPLPFFCSWI